MEQPKNVHDLVPKDGKKLVGKIEDPYVASDVELSTEAFNSAAEELLDGEVSTKEKYGIEDIKDIIAQLDAQKESYESALSQLHDGDTSNIGLLKETLNVLRDFDAIIEDLKRHAPGGLTSKEIAAASKTVKERLAQIGETMEEAHVKFA